MTELLLSPLEEAAQAIVDRLNTGDTYALDRPAEYTPLKIDPVEQIEGVLVDVVTGKSKSLKERLDTADNTSHEVKIWIRAKLDGKPETRDEQIWKLSLMFRMIFIRMEDFRSDDGRVQVWECDEEPLSNPVKQQLIQASLYAACIKMRVEVAR